MSVVQAPGILGYEKSKSLLVEATCHLISYYLRSNWYNHVRGAYNKGSSGRFKKAKGLLLRYKAEQILRLI